MFTTCRSFHANIGSYTSLFFLYCLTIITAAPLHPPPSSMADFFAPNLEDGELWLPSDVFLEIASTNVNNKVQKNTNKKSLGSHNPSLHGDHVYDDFTSFSNVSSPEMEV